MGEKLKLPELDIRASKDGAAALAESSINLQCSRLVYFKQRSHLVLDQKDRFLPNISRSAPLMSRDLGAFRQPFGNVREVLLI